MSLSSTTLFHFTRSYGVLVKILREGLQPRFCVEYAWGDKDLIIPMICTCDIPLSEIGFHRKKYGEYGIGLKKSFAKNKGFTPVFYLSDKSKLYELLAFYAKNMKIPSMSPWDKIEEETLLYYAKRSVGTDCDREHLKMTLKPKFSNEKEWRYVPEISPSVHMYVEQKGKGQDVDKERLNKSTEHLKIALTPDSINYLIVNNEDERMKLFKELAEIAKEKGDSSWKNKFQELQTRIISTELMKEDF